MRRGKRMRRSLAIFLVMAMLLTIVPWSPVLAAEAPPAEESRTEELPGAEAAEAPEQLPERDSFGGILQGSGEAELPAIHTGMPGEEEQVRVLVELEQEPLTKVTGALLDGALSPTGLARQEALLEQHGSIQAQIQALAEEREIEVRYDYTLLANGFSLACPYGLVDDIRAVDGVRSVELCQTYSLPTEPQMNSGNEMIGSREAWSLGLDGTGMVVAVVDTGLDTDHPAFAQDPGAVTLTQEKLEQLVEAKALRAQRISGVGAAGLRMSDKVPFAFDYAGGDTDVNHNGSSDHGTHVAGTVTADPADGTISGVAPKAQLVVMKVFADGATGAVSDDILAALEDCVTLGVDVVNLSLGSPAGFTQRQDLLTTMEVYDRLEDAGIVVAAAAGNEFSAAYKNQWETDLSLASNPDYGIVGSPSTYTQTLSVASVDNEKIRSSYFQVGERKISFTDTAATYDPEGQLVKVLGGQTLAYVVVPGFGQEADYTGLDVKGKVALVSRGTTTFQEKYDEARAQGAAACIIYNNDVGLINMAITEYPIPAVFISQTDGKAMIDAAQNGQGTLYVAQDTFEAIGETGGQPSDFSSWGTTAGLEITPDLMAPGGNIYSSRDNGAYGLMSGTSMATPHVSGAAALLLQYIRSQDNALLTEEQLYNLLMSTAVPAKDGAGVPYSPRKQGAGLVNLASALSTGAYLQVPGEQRAKLELGDDPGKTGVYTMTFQVVNFGTESLRYAFYGCGTLETAPFGVSLEEIGDYGFYSCKKLTSLTLPDRVKTVGIYAFAWCSGITEANLGGGLETLGKYAFFYCTALTSVTFGGAMDTIGNYAFYKCSKLASVNLGDSLRVIGDGAFSGCTKITAISLPDSVRVVGSYGFNGCSGVKTLDLGQGVEEIGASAFKGLKAVTTLTIPDSVRSIGSTAFGFMSGLLELNLNGNTKQYGSSIFNAATKLPAVELPEGMTEIPASMFSGCSALTTVSIPETVTVIQESAFRSCKKLTGVVLPRNLTYIGDGAFYACAGLTSVSIPDPVTYVGDQAFRDLTNMTQLTIGVSVETIGDFAFYGCTKLTQVTLPDSVKSLGTSAFNKNSALKTFTFGTGLQSIGSMCFNMCYQLEAIQVPEGNTAFAARDGVLYSKSMDTVVWYPQGKADTAYVMPETVKHIGPYGIYEVAALTSVTVSSGLETIDEFGLARLNITGTLSLPATVNSIHFKAFLYDYSLQGLETPGENATFQTRDGVLFTKDMSTLLVYPAGKPEISYTVPAGVRTVGTYAFYYNKGLQQLGLTDVTMVEEYAFYNAKGLVEADFGNALVNVDTYAFNGCSNLARLLGTGALENIGANAFSSCGLTYVLLPAIRTVGSYAFSFNQSMTRAVLGENVSAIYASAFNYCTAMTEAYLLGAQPENVGTNIFNKTAADFTVYYDQGRTADWAPGGETKWGAYPIAPTTFHTVTFLDVDHSVLLEEPVAQSQAAIVPQEPSRPEAPFTGWSADSSQVTEDMVILAQYEGLKDTLTVTAQALGNGTVTPEGTTWYFYDSDAPYIFTPAEGYHVEQVTVNGQELGALEGYTFRNLREDGNLTVRFAINTYTVTYVDGLDGQIIATQTVEHGADAQAPAILPSHTGYHFTGWDKDGGNVTADRMITAQYEVNTYTVRFLDGTGAELSVQTVAHGQSAQVPEAPQWEGHTFAGWSGDSSCVVSDMTIQALYTTNRCTVFFTDWDGTVLKTQEVSYGEAAQAPDAPIREGHTFTGWSQDFSRITESLIVTAQYRINTYTVRFLDWDGKELSVQTVTYGDGAEAPQTPEREGFHFTGWDVSFTCVTEDLTVTAQYEGNTYTVRFLDWDGRELSVQTVAHGQAAQAPEPPQRKGYRFTGWDTDFALVQSDLTVTARYEAALPFTDVREGSWYYEAVLWAYVNGIMQGMDAETFRPEGECTRAQFVTVLYRLSGETAPEAGSTFADVAQGRYYTEAVAWAQTTGIVQGTGDNTFSPEARLTREQLVTFLYRYARYQGLDVTASGDLTAFPDAPSVHGWAEEAMAWAVDAGIIAGMDGSLAPAANATRAQCAAILQRFAGLK